MTIYCVTIGQHRVQDQCWVAANNPEQAKSIAQQYHESVRAVHVNRPVGPDDAIPQPGRVVFCGFGPSGPAKLWA